MASSRSANDSTVPSDQYNVAQIAVLEDERFLGLIGREQLLHLIRNRLELAA